MVPLTVTTLYGRPLKVFTWKFNLVNNAEKGETQKTETLIVKDVNKELAEKKTEDYNDYAEVVTR